MINTELMKEPSQLDVLFPASRTVTIARAGATEPETLVIYAMPLQKWKQGIAYIAQIAPLLGFDISGMADDAKKKVTGEAVDQPEQTDTPAEDAIDTAKLFAALQGDGADLILEFTAFAIDRDVTFFDGMYDEIIDILAAVIELNLNFFVQKLLPKIVTGTQQVVKTVQQVKQSVSK